MDSSWSSWSKQALLRFHPRLSQNLSSHSEDEMRPWKDRWRGEPGQKELGNKRKPFDGMWEPSLAIEPVWTELSYVVCSIICLVIYIDCLLSKYFMKLSCFETRPHVTSCGQQCSKPTQSTRQITVACVYLRRRWWNVTARCRVLCCNAAPTKCLSTTVTDVSTLVDFDSKKEAN